MDADTMTEAGAVFDCGGEELVGVVHLPPGAGPATAGVVIVVGGPQYRAGSHRQFVLLARRLARAGFPVLRFDCRGMGDSSGQSRTFETLDDDIGAAIAELRRRTAASLPVVLVGLCDGASAALMYGHAKQVAGMVLINPWVRTEKSEASVYVRHYYAQRVLQPDFWKKLFSGEVAVARSVADFAGKLWRTLAKPATAGGAVTKNFLETMSESFSRHSGRMLVVLSERDFTAREFEAFAASDPAWTRLHDERDPRTACVKLEGADHTFSSRRDLDTSCDVIAGWLAREFPPQP